MRAWVYGLLEEPSMVDENPEASMERDWSNISNSDGEPVSKKVRTAPMREVSAPDAAVPTSLEAPVGSRPEEVQILPSCSCTSTPALQGVPPTTTGS